MNNNTERINSYLEHKMNDDEKTAFEAELTTNEALKNELYAQQQVLNAVMHAGIKSEFAKAIRHKLLVKRWITWGSLAAACIIAVLFLTFRAGIFSSVSPLKIFEETASPVANIVRPFIDPPLPGANVPLHTYSFDAEKGDTIVYPSGSIIYFPPSSLVDKAGNLVTGKVTVTYREFADPLDFFVSGIPMSYDSAGKQYNFESAAMCEINAYKDNKAVFVNPGAKPEINLSCTNKNPEQNLYFLDTVKRKWEFIGKDMITAVKDLVPKKKYSKQVAAIETDFLVQKPVKPIKASDDKQSFSIEIEPESFDELQSYNGLKFEVVDESKKTLRKNTVHAVHERTLKPIDESVYKPSDADEHWDNVKLDRTATEGIYIVTFTNAKRKVAYKVRPVLEGSDYDAALKVFEEKNRTYETALNTRLANEKILGDSINQLNKKRTEDMDAEYAFNERMNKMIRERNKRLREIEQQLVNDQQKFMEANQQRLNDQYLLMNRRQALAAADEVSTNEAIRTFPVSMFGFWNCDQPLLPQGAIPITASFTDSMNNEMNVLRVSLVNRGFNGIIPQLIENKTIVVFPGKANMLWFIKDASFYYFTYDDFAATGINATTKNYVFRMRKEEKRITSYNEIRALVGDL